MLVSDFLCEKINLLLAIRRTFIAQLTRMSTQTITQFPLYFCEVRRDDLFGDSQRRQRRTCALLGDFTGTPYFASEEGASIGMKRSVGHIS